MKSLSEDELALEDTSELALADTTNLELADETANELYKYLAEDSEDLFKTLQNMRHDVLGIPPISLEQIQKGKFQCSRPLFLQCCCYPTI